MRPNILRIFKELLFENRMDSACSLIKYKFRSLTTYFQIQFSKYMQYTSNRQMMLSIILLFLSMLLLSFAAVPIYNLFCKATGFGGTTQRANQYNKVRIGTNKLDVYFDANIDPNLPWRFIPKHRKIEVITGQSNLVFYEAENLSDKDIIGTAIYNVTPLKAGKYFIKIHCFCFEEQLLKAGQKLLMPVSFYIDPDFDQDEEMRDVTSITLSYSFFKTRELRARL